MLAAVIISSLFILGLYAAMADGMILERLHGVFEHITDNNLLRPIRPALYDCPICMASIWGTAVWLLLGGGIGIQWGIHVFAVAGLNYVIINMMEE